MNPRLRLTNRGDRTRRRGSAEQLAAAGTIKPRAATVLYFPGDAAVLGVRGGPA